MIITMLILSTKAEAATAKINTETAKTLNAACPISDGQAEFGVFFDGGQKHA